MPRITKPSFPNPATADLKRSLENVRDAVTVATDANGKVDLHDVEAQLQSDAAAKSALDAIRSDDAFAMTELRSVGCGGGTQTVQVPTDRLEGSQVQSVLSALVTAKAALDALDTDGDGRIDKGEAAAAGGSALPRVIADAALDGALEGFEAQMDQWASALRSVRYDVDERGRFENYIQDVCGDHAETELGRQALAWGFREVFARGGKRSWDEMNKELKSAETHWLGFFPLFGAPKRNHLSEREIKKHLGTDDLQGFIDATRERIKNDLGGTWEEHWLEGKDIENADQLDDPDFAERTTSSSGGGC
jgi:hypothetical protein